MDLPQNWEKKALIIVGAVFIISVIYAMNPFQSTPTNDTLNESSSTTIIPNPFPKITKSKNANNSSVNGTFNITAEQAKKIATQSRPGYTVGQPIQGNVVVNSTNYSVWIVPLSQNNVVSKTIYIDANTGIIVLEI
jgi:hypothetical protein